MGRLNGGLCSDFLKSGVFYSVVTNALFICRVEKGVETSVHITEFAVIRILVLDPACAIVGFAANGTLHNSDQCTVQYSRFRKKGPSIQEKPPKKQKTKKLEILWEGLESEGFWGGGGEGFL